MAAAADEEYVQLKLNEVFVYKIPPKTSAAGHKAADWKDQVWVGKLEVVIRGSQVVIKLVGEDGKIFAVAPVRKDGPPAVEKVSDSSRYFVLRIENDKGQYAFIGIGFNNRSDAFDFNVALQDAQKDTDASKRAALDLGPALDLSLKAGEKITIKIGGAGGSGSGAGSSAAAHKPASTGAPSLAPPGGALKLRAPGSTAAAAPVPVATSGSDFGLGGLSIGGSASTAAPVAKAPAPAPASSWETF